MLPSGGLFRILLVEDHVLLRESLVCTLEAEEDFFVAGQCGSATEALDIVARTPVDLVLLDLNLGTEQGGAFLNQCKNVGYEGQVLVVTAGVGDRELAWLQRRGCTSIFLKHEPLEDLIERIRAIRDGRVEPARPIDLPQAGPDIKGRPALTVREREVLRCICEGLANKEIAARLQIAETSVKSLLQQLFHKIGVRTRAQLVREAIEQYWDEL